jgi:hypothetical protein
MKSLVGMEDETASKQIVSRPRHNTISCSTTTKHERELFDLNVSRAGSTPLDLSSHDLYKIDIEQNIYNRSKTPPSLTETKANNNLKLQIALIGLGATTISALAGLIVSLASCSH